jgi:hypothetical protein
MIYLECHLKGQSSLKLSYHPVLPHSQDPVQDATCGDEGVEDLTAWFAGQRVYPPKYITLGQFSIVSGEEAQRATSMC